MTPAPEEVEEARRVLATMTPQQVRARKGSLAYYLKTSGDTAGQELRGQARSEALEQFLVLQMRNKQAKREITSERKVSSSTAKHNEVHDWSTERLKREVGEVKAQKWMNSGKLSWSADEITGEDSVDMRTWHIPVRWTTSINGQSSSATMAAAEEAGAEDVKDFAAAFDIDDDKGSVDPAIKTEKVPESPADALAAEVANFKKSIMVTLRTWQDKETKIKTMVAVAEAQKYIPDAFVSDSKKLVSKITRVVKIISKWATEGTFIDSELPPLMKCLKCLESDAGDLVSYGERLNLVEAKRAKRRRKQ